jgi:hypothetical protein
VSRFKHLAAFCRAIMAVLVGFGHVDWTDAQIMLVVAAIEAAGALIYAEQHRA